MKSYLIKTFGIIMVAALAGVTHFALGEKIEFVKLPPIEGNGPLIPVDGQADAPADPPETQDPSAETGDETEAVPTEGSGLGRLEREITTEQAQYLFEHNLAQFLDARPKDDYEAGHILDANHLSPASFESGTPSIVDWLLEDLYVVVYCSGGDCHESHLVASDLMLYRPDLANQIHIFTDGYPAWTEAGLPTEIGPDPLAE